MVMCLVVVKSKLMISRQTPRHIAGRGGGEVGGAEGAIPA
jgi:hypothetical protein